MAPPALEVGIVFNTGRWSQPASSKRPRSAMTGPVVPDAEDYGLRYIRGVFGRIRGCYLRTWSARVRHLVLKFI